MSAAKTRWIGSDVTGKIGVSWIEERCAFEPNSGCWLWAGKSDRNGYAQAKACGRMWFVHRVSYALYKGDPGSLHVLHTCDNPYCCNPDHLTLGTHQENVTDAVTKRRHAHGQRSGAAKLTEKDVVAMRAIRATGVKYADIAEMFGVSMRAACNACNGKYWSHIHENIAENRRKYQGPARRSNRRRAKV